MTESEPIQKISKEQKARLRVLLQLNAVTVMILSAFGVLFLDKIEAFLGDRIAPLLLGALFFMSIVELIVARTVFGEVDRR